MAAAPTGRTSSGPHATTRPGDGTVVEQRIKLRLVLPSNARAPGIARKELARFARGVELVDRDYDAVRLLVSELVTNAVRHAGARGREKIGVCVQSSHAPTRIEVPYPALPLAP